MASNSVVFEVIVTDKGLKVVTKNLDELGSKVENVGSRQKAADKASKDFYDTQKKGIVGTANSTKSFSKLAETIGSSSGLVGAYATLAANIFAVTAAFNALRNASQVEQVFLGLEAAGNRLGQTLSITARGLKEVTANAISTEQSLRSTAQVISAGFGEEQVLALGRAARDTSFALGRNLTDSMDRLTRGVVKLEPELLDELGIMTKLTESNTNYAASLGKSVSQLTNFEKRQGFLNAVIAEADLKFGGLAESAGNSTAYDKLAANFADLTQNVLSFINIAAKPLASILGSSQGALAGAALLFASGISKQLLPGLASIADKSVKATQRLKELAVASRENAKASQAQALAEKSRALEAARGAVSSINKGPKGFNNLVSAIKDGTATERERQKALSSLIRSERLHSSQLEHMTVQERQNAVAKRETLATVRAQIEALRALSAAEQNAANSAVTANATVMAARRAALAASLQVKAQQSASDALFLASNGKYRDSFNGIIKATKEYGKAQAVAAGGALSSMGALRTAAFATSVGIRAIGAAFLAAIPIIGQVVFVLGLLYSGFQALKSDAVKKAEQAMEDFNTVMGGVNDKVKEFNRVQNSLAPASQRAAQSLVIQANTVDEIVNAYNAARAAQSSFFKEKNESSSVAGFFESGTDKGFVSYKTGIDQNSKILQIFKQELEGVASWNFGALTNDLKLPMQTLDSLSKSAPEATKNIIELHGGLDRLESLNTNKKLSEVNAIINEIQKSSGPAADRIKNLVESMKEADTALGSFLLASVQTTPYDKVVSSVESVTSSIRSFQNAVALGESGSADWQKVLQGIGPDMEKFLSPDTSKYLQLSVEADKIVQSLNAQVAAGQKLTPYQESKLEVAKQDLAVSNSKLGTMAKEIEGIEALFRKNQSIERINKSQLTLAQARLQSNQQNYQITAQAESARIDAENRIKDLQAKSLQAQKALLDAAILHQKTKIKSLETEGLITAEIRKQGSETINNSILVARQNLEAIKKQIDGRAGSFLPQNLLSRVDPGLAKLVSQQTAAEKVIDELQKKYDNLELYNGIQKEISGLESASKSLANEIAAIFESKITPAEKLAAMAAKEVEIQNARLTALTAQKAAITEANEEYLKQAALITGRNGTLSEELRILRASAKVQKETLSNEYASKQATLQAELGKVEAARSRAKTDSEKAANASIQEYYRTELDLNTQGYNIDLQRIEAQNTTAQLEKVIFDTRKEGLEWQQSSLDYLQKSIDAQRSLSESVQDQLTAQTKLSLKRRGLEMSDEGNEAIEIRTAAAAYKIAVQEVEIKKSLIDLEYALLDAQREQLRDNLAERRAFLAENNKDGVFDSRINQLDTTLDRISNIDTSRIAETLKKNLDTQLETQRVELQTLTTPSSRGNNALIAFMEGIEQRRKARRQAQEALETRRVPVAPMAKADPLPKATNDSIENKLVASNKGVIEAINRWIEAIKSEVTSSSATDVINMSVKGAAKQALDFFMSKGWTAAQSAGIVGNLQQESGKNLDPKAKNTDAGLHLGIAQWSTARMADFSKVFGKSLADSTREEQLKFIQWELENTEKTAGKMLKAAGNVEQATLAFSKHFERAGAGANDPRRVANARSLVSQVEQVVSSVVAKSPANDNQASSDIVVTAQPKVKPVLDEVDLKLAIPFIEVPIKIDPSVALKDFSEMEDNLAVFGKVSESVISNLRDLGVSGEPMAAALQGIYTMSSASLDMMKILDDTTSSQAAKITAVATVASAALGTIQSVLSATADAKIANIDREIAAEQKRDGKSADSLKKIETLEKKKDQIAKKQFNTNKKLMMAQAIISTASGMAQALGTLGPIAGPIMAAVIGAMGAAQIAIIAGTSYQSTGSSAASMSAPSSLTIGRTGDTVDLAKNNSNLGGELGYLRGKPGQGSNSSNYAVVGSAYGGDLPRGYGNTAYMVGEKGPELLTAETPISVTPVNDNQQSQPINASISIQALDATGVEEILFSQRGNIISMLREAANANGQNFLEAVNTNVYTRPNIGKL